MKCTYMKCTYEMHVRVVSALHVISTFFLKTLREGIGYPQNTLHIEKGLTEGILEKQKQTIVGEKEKCVCIQTLQYT